MFYTVRFQSSCKSWVTTLGNQNETREPKEIKIKITYLNLANQGVSGFLFSLVIRLLLNARGFLSVYTIFFPPGDFLQCVLRWAA